jgi:hypothetical protein
MFTSLTTLMKIPLVTTDGKEHQVCGLLFDDRSWTICFLVADAGSWLSRRQVVIRTGATDEPDWTKKVIAANLTHQELVRCADVSSVKPVSQQQQLALKKYFGWPDSEPRWYVPAALVPAQREFPVQANDDPHLRNTTDYRTWLLYMAGSAATFNCGDIAVYQVLIRRLKDQCGTPMMTQESCYQGWSLHDHAKIA